MRDAIDTIADRLGRLVTIMEERQGLGEPDVTINQDLSDARESARTPTYFSTGPDKIAVENTDFTTPLEFGFVARTVNIRTDDKIIVSFTEGSNQGDEIAVKSTESPFTIGGDVGIHTDRVYIKQDPAAGGTPGIQVIAYR